METYPNGHLVVKEEVEKQTGFRTVNEIPWRKATVVSSNNSELIGKSIIYHPTTRMQKDKTDNTYYIAEKSILEIL